MQRSMFFDSVARDRVYTSDSWAVIFGKFVRDGYLAEEYAGAGLSVVPTDPAARKVKVNLGSAWVQGRAFEVYDTPEELDLPENTSGNPRVDRIVVRLDRTARTVALAVKAGTPAASPAAPALTRDSSVWELSLARVTVASGATTITAGQIVDERDDTSVCGVARGPRISTQAQAMTTAERDALTDGLFGGRLAWLTDAGLLTVLTDGGAWKVVGDYGYGDGSDGDVTITGTVTLTRDMQYRSLTIASGGVLNTGGYTIRASESVTVNAGGIVSANGENGTHGTGTVGGSGGNSPHGGGGGGYGTYPYSSNSWWAGGGGGGGGGVVCIITPKLVNNGTIRANGGNGGNGTTSPSTNGSSGTSGTGRVNGSGGGGRSTTHDYAGGNGGTAYQNNNGGVNSLSLEYAPQNVGVVIPIRLRLFGGGGGGGGQGSGWGKGGGGGGGGLVFTLTRSRTGSGTYSVAGGSGGVGYDSNHNGAAGSAGQTVHLTSA